MIGRVRREMKQLTKMLDRAAEARRRGLIPYITEDSMGRQSVRTAPPGDPVPPSWREIVKTR